MRFRLSPTLPKISRDGLTLEHRASQLRLLRLLQDVIRDNESFQTIFLDEALVHAFSTLKLFHGWQWSTTATHAGAILGAWPRLLQYTALTPLAERLHRWHLNGQAVWRDALRNITLRAKTETVKFPVAVTKTQVTQLLHTLRESNPPLHALCLLAWDCCARIGDAAQFHADDVFLQDNGDLDFHFRRGKSVTARGPYAVQSFIRPESADFKALKRFLDAAPPGQLFPHTTALQHKKWGVSLRDALRTIDGRLEQRSFRRGALQLLARDPATTHQTLLHFSGHTNVAMLKRYLNWGAINANEAQQARTAALRLLDAELLLPETPSMASMVSMNG
jgi:integrase